MTDPVPGLSLIMTFFNEEDSAARFFDDLPAWTRLPDEIVMVDGGSTDRTVGVVRDRIPGAPVPVVLVETGGCNISQGRNIAVRTARHDLIASTDLGCVVEPGWLARLAAPFDDPAVDVASGYYEPICQTPVQHCYRHLTHNPDIARATWLPSSRSIAFRRGVWEAVGGYPEHLNTAEDTWFDLRVRERGFHEVFVPDARVRWEARDSCAGIFRQYLRYARGAGSGLVQPLLYGFYTANYLLFAFWAAVTLFVCPYASIAGAAHALAYAWLRIFRKPLVRAHLSPMNLLRYAAITLCIDLGTILGYPLGILDRVSGRSQSHAPPSDRGDRYGTYVQK